MEEERKWRMKAKDNLGSGDETFSINRQRCYCAGQKTKKTKKKKKKKNLSG